MVRVTQPAAHLEAVHVRKKDVQYDGVVRALLGHANRVFAGRDRVDAEALFLESALEQPRNLLGVLYDEYLQSDLLLRRRGLTTASRRMRAAVGENAALDGPCPVSDQHAGRSTGN
jgi:hypothetical protein